MNAIEFENISKQYKLGYVSTKTLSHDLNRWWTVHVRHKEDPYLKIGSVNDRSKKADSDYVWALKDINFNVEQGDVVGIIGKNGAGKSTLLKLLSRVTAPTTGEIRARGRIASLLEVGTGFHTELTGRENIYMNGSIMGMTKKEIKSKLDEIVDFAGVERYIDTPVKRYSSGMMVRLGFAVAAHLDPEILVVDEVLAVGDAEFQKKAIGKMQDVSKGEGRTVLFVSHNMTSMKTLCNNGILLENGMVKYAGTMVDVINKYINNTQTTRSYDISNVKGYTGNGVLRVGKVSIHSEGDDNGVVRNNKPVIMEVTILNPMRESGLFEIAGTIKNNDRIYLHYFASKFNAVSFRLPNHDSFIMECRFESLPFTPGTYFLGFELMLNRDIVFLLNECIEFDIIEDDFYGTGIKWDRGLVLEKQQWKLK